MAKDWMKKLQDQEGAVAKDFDIWRPGNTIGMPSPSLGYVWGKTHGLPRGFSCILWGVPGGGKSLIANAIAGQLHKDDPEAWIVKYSTELREAAQVTKQQRQLVGIDDSRYMAYDRNQPELIYDAIEGDLAAMCQDGFPLKLVIIDSLTNIQGRREQNSDSILNQSIGDLAATNAVGLKRIQPTLRKYGIALLCTQQARAELDPWEVKRNGPEKMAGGVSTKHMIEYFMQIKKDVTVDGRKNLMGEEFVNEDAKDLAGKAERTAFKVRFTMGKSSLGPDGRSGEFTWDLKKGIINTHEEIFELGVNLGIIQKPTNQSYEFKSNQWRGKEAMLTAIKDDQELYLDILNQIKQRDL